MIGSLLSRLACILVGHVYPLYRTFKVIQCLPQKMAKNSSIEGTSVLDLKRVVAFWTVIGAFTFAEFFIDFFVFMIPMYYEAKILFLIWLIHNNFSGAVFFFDNFIDEILSKHELEIDVSLENSKKAFRRQISAGVGAIADVAAQAGVAALKKVSLKPLPLLLFAM
jgi:receptor expression-enhancing protein 1/2/3/4